MAPQFPGFFVVYGFIAIGLHWLANTISKLLSDRHQFSRLIRSEWPRLVGEGKVDIGARDVGRFKVGYNVALKATVPPPGTLPVRPLTPETFTFDKIKDKIKIFARFVL